MAERTSTVTVARARVDAALRRRANWEQLVKFCVVGATGYVVNLAVYAILLEVAGFHYLPAAIGSFLVAVTNNYLWNRLWTFRHQRGHVVLQGARFLVAPSASVDTTRKRAPWSTTWPRWCRNVQSRFQR